MIINREKLLSHLPITDMERGKKVEHGVSYGLAEVGYDIRIKQEVRFEYRNGNTRVSLFNADGSPYMSQDGRFTLASTIERFQMPNTLAGVVHDKSTWARRGLSVFNTVIEPGWHGFLTLELVFHCNSDLIIPAGSGIAQVLFHEISMPAEYRGKYQNQADMPVEGMYEK